MTEYNIFCYAEDCDEDDFQQPRYRAFNKKVGESRYDEIRSLIKDDILKGLKLEFNKNNWEDEWKKVTPEQWKRILEIPEADKEIIEKIIGFELGLEEEMVELSDGARVSEKTIREALEFVAKNK
jgi:hypothetical protein